MKTMKYLIPTALLAVFLYSCSGETTYEKSVTNWSSGPVRLELINSENPLLDTLLQPGQTIVIETGTKDEGLAEPGDPSEDISYFVMYNLNNDTCKLNYLEPLDWQSLSERTKKTPANYNHTHNFVVTDADF